MEPGSATGTNLSILTWYHIALVANGTTIEVFLNGVSDASRTDDDFTETNIALGKSIQWGDWINGRIAAFKLWDATLTAAEIQLEMQTYVPQRLANINRWTPLLPGTTERLADYSGSGLNWTSGGTPTDESDPPIVWDLIQPRFYFSPAGAAPGRTTKNTDIQPLGIHTGMSRRISQVVA